MKKRDIKVMNRVEHNEIIGQMTKILQSRTGSKDILL
jgi:hypothetical protein